jgi:mRNA interferase MazF
MVIEQYDIYLVNLDPTIGSEIKKTRPCLIISPIEMNRHLNTVIIAPLTSNTKQYPSRVDVVHNKKHGSIVLDQIRTIDKRRLISKQGRIDSDTMSKVKDTIRKMLVD